MQLPRIIAEHINAVNTFDANAIVATFAEDAYVNDNRREIVGLKAIRKWVEKEIVGDRVTLDVREATTTATPSYERHTTESTIRPAFRARQFRAQRQATVQPLRRP
jgi:hypothetical protein